MPTQEQAICLCRLVSYLNRVPNGRTFDKAIHGVSSDSRFVTESECLSEQLICAHDQAISN